MEKTKELTQKLNQLFETKVDIPRIRHGKSQTVGTLINEEAMLLGKYLRNEIQTWKPRIVYRYGSQNMQIKAYLERRRQILNVLKKLNS